MDFDATQLIQSPQSAGGSNEEMERRYPRLWAERVVATETGEPYDFVNRPWLRRIWDDTYPRQVIQKCTQVGITTYAYCKTLHRASQRGSTVIYTFPTKGDVGEFVKGRLDKVIEASPGLQVLMRRPRGRGGARATDNVGIKHVGKGTIYFRGTQTASGAVSVPAHMLIHDELDLSDQKIIASYRHRLDNVDPDKREIVELSNPTTENYGINERFLDSDGREWFVRCACGWRGELNYWEHTRNGTLDRLACTVCSRTLDPRNGRWVAARPGRDFHGYHISKLMRCVPDRPDLVLDLETEQRRARFPYVFTNMSLGLPSDEDSISLTEALIKSKCFLDPHPMSEVGSLYDGPWFMGVDQGDTLTVTIGTAPGDLYIARFLVRLRPPDRGSSAWDILDTFMTRFRIELAVVDGLPNGNNAHDFAKRWKGRVLLCYYSDSQRAIRRTNHAVDEKLNVANARFQRRTRPTSQREIEDDPEITVGRTDVLDRTAAALTTGRFQLPETPDHPEVAAFITHCAANARQPVEDDEGNLHYVWKRKNVNDFFHSATYFMEAVEMARRLGRGGFHHVAPVTIHGFAAPPISNRPSPGGVLLPGPGKILSI